MKDVRLKLLDEEYEAIRSDAEQLQLSVRQLIHDRATGRDSIQAALYSALVLSEEMARIRGALNQIIRRETEAEIRLYEDDVIQVERIMAELEQMVTRYIADTLREVQSHGQPAV